MHISTFFSENGQTRGDTLWNGVQDVSSPQACKTHWLGNPWTDVHFFRTRQLSRTYMKKLTLVQQHPKLNLHIWMKGYMYKAAV